MKEKISREAQKMFLQVKFVAEMINPWSYFTYKQVESSKYSITYIHFKWATNTDVKKKPKVVTLLKL